MTSFAKQCNIRYRKRVKEEKQSNCTLCGYYAVVEDKRYFISEKVDEDALNDVLRPLLNKENNYDYWIDYSYGADVDGKPAWANLDFSDRFTD